METSQMVMINQNENENESTTGILDLFFELLRKWYLILIIAIICGGGTFVYTYFAITPTYDSVTKIYILNRQGEDNQITQSDLNSSSQLLKDYMALIKTRPVIEGAIETLELNTTYEKLVKSISVSNTSDTRIISITATATSPEAAQKLANAIKVEVGKQIVNVMNVESVNTVEEANLPINKARPNTMKNTALGGAVGFFLTCIVISIIHLTDDRIRFSEDVEKYLKLPVLGSIPKDDLLDDIRNKKGRGSKKTRSKVETKKIRR